MSYRLKRKDDDVTAAIQRIALEQLDAAIDELEHSGIDRHETVHQVRKRFKKIRGLIRLTRHAFAKTYQAENAWFRDAGRDFSAVRDAEAFLETYDKLMQLYAAEINRSAFGPIRRKLTQRRQLIADEQVDLDQRLQQLRVELSAARKRVKSWRLNHSGFKALADSVAKSYRRGQQAMRVAYDAPTAEHFHEWRKRAKYHWYHMRLLQNLWQPVLKARRDELKQLTTYLGDEHDLAEFRHLLIEHADEFGDDTTRTTLICMIDRRRDELQALARPLGHRLYAEKPKHLVARLNAYWDAWQQESDR